VYFISQIPRLFADTGLTIFFYKQSCFTSRTRRY
jgi:hypothetical protein